MLVQSLLHSYSRSNGFFVRIVVLAAVLAFSFPVLAQIENTSATSSAQPSDTTAPKATTDWKSVEDFIYPQKLGKFDMAVGLAYGGGLTSVYRILPDGNKSYDQSKGFSRLAVNALITGEYSILGSTVFRNPKHKLRIGDIFEFKIGGRSALYSNLPENYADQNGYRQQYWYDHLSLGAGYGFAIAYKTQKIDYLLKLKVHNDFSHVRNGFARDGKITLEGLITRNVWQYGFGFAIPEFRNDRYGSSAELGTTYIELAKRLNSGQLLGLRLAFQHQSHTPTTDFYVNASPQFINSVQATAFWRLQR